MIQKTGLALCLLPFLISISCSSHAPQPMDAGLTNTPTSQNAQYPVQQPTHQAGNKPDANQAAPAWEEYSEEDIACEKSLDEAIICISMALKKGFILSMQNEFTICLRMHKDDRNNAKISLLRMQSAPRTKPVVTGEVLHEYSLPGNVTFAEQERYFWYDKQGNIDFFEPDQILRTFDNPPQGDIVLLPKNTKIPRRAVIDVTKSKTELQYHQYLIAQ